MSDPVPILEAAQRVAGEFGIRTADLKPCVALLLDGNLGATPRHKAAFIIAIELWRIGRSEVEADKLVQHWARRHGHNPREASRSARNAYATKPGGGPKYHPPGLVKKPSGVYATLAPTCRDVGCPQNCPPLQHLRQGGKGENLKRWESLGWPAYLKRKRWSVEADVYRAICLVEIQRGFAPGQPLFVTYRQIAEHAARDHSGIGRALDRLHDLGLLAELEKGSGSGPHARDRKATRLTRTTPIPSPPPLPA